MQRHPLSASSIARDRICWRDGIPRDTSPRLSQKERLSARKLHIAYPQRFSIRLFQHNVALHRCVCVSLTPLDLGVHSCKLIFKSQSLHDFGGRRPWRPNPEWDKTQNAKTTLHSLGVAFCCMEVVNSCSCQHHTGPRGSAFSPSWLAQDYDSLQRYFCSHRCLSHCMKRETSKDKWTL